MTWIDIASIDAIAVWKLLDLSGVVDCCPAGFTFARATVVTQSTPPDSGSRPPGKHLGKPGWVKATNPSSGLFMGGEDLPVPAVAVLVRFLPSGTGRRRACAACAPRLVEDAWCGESDDEGKVAASDAAGFV
jgi:hypothetical protein